jgi:hypothetical protein
MFTFVQRMCVFAAAGVGLFAQSTPVVPASDARTSGMIGIVAGQNARLNALNVGVPSVATPANAVACTATLTFWDGGGTPLKSLTVGVPAGKNMYLDLFGEADLALGVLDRREIRGTITLPPAPVSTTSTLPTPCKIIGSLELIDVSTNKTLVVVGVGHDLPSAVTVTATP